MTDTTHKGLADALLAFQQEAPKLLKDSTAKAGSFSYKYVDLASVVEAIRPLMVKHGLAWSTFPTCTEQGQPALRYRLTHAPTGEAEQDTMPLMIQKADPQGQGSAISYARRYALTAVLDLIADVDDDGQAASKPQRQATRQATAAPAQQTERPASAKQRGLINARAGDAGLPPSDLADLLCDLSGIDRREFETEDQAAQWVNRQLDRLPARMVTPLLEKIEGQGAVA